MKDPESMLLHVPCDGCSHVTHPSRAETGISNRCPVSSGECSRFSWQPRAAPSAAGALPFTSSQQLSASSHFVVPWGFPAKV